MDHATTNEPSHLAGAIASSLGQYVTSFAKQARALTADLTDEEFWTRPYPYGNSVGHLVLHITGNLNHFIGAHIAGTGYVRNRDLEFTDASRRPKDDVLRALDEAATMVSRTLSRQTPEDWSRQYDAAGPDDPTRFSIVLRCVAHFYHHLGQIIYLAKEHARRRSG